MTPLQNGIPPRYLQSSGTRPVIRLCSVGMVFTPLAWLFAQPGEYLGLAAVSFVSGLMAGD